MNNTAFAILTELAIKQAIPADNIPRTLGAAKVKNAAANNAALQLPDGGGLLLYVSPSGSKAWRYRFRLNGKGQTLTIGNYPEVGLADARTAHRAARWLVERGTHPLPYIEAEQRRLDAELLQATTGTFRAVWEQFDQATRANLAPRTVKHRQAHVDKYILPKIGGKQVREITRGELASLLSEIDRDKPETAKFCRIYIKQVFELAVDRDQIPGNPTPKPSTLINHSGRKAIPRKAMATGQLGRFLVELENAADTDPLTKAAMRLLLLTWARTAEIIGAEWAEFDLDAAAWRIPAARMKARELHTVYLSNQAVAVLRDLAMLSHGRYLFPNRRRPGEAHMNRTTLTQWRTSRAVEGRRTTAFEGREGYRREAVGAADHARQWTDHPGTAVRQTPVLDLNAGPLSRSAAIARPDLVIRTKEARPAGPFGDLVPDSGTAREAVRPIESKEWVGFADDSGTLGIPRAEMPQIKAEHRGAMTQFMNARGVKHRAEEVRADLLKPTQAEFSPAKVKKAHGFEGGERSILVSSDGYILDGHHQWLAKREQGKSVDVIRFDAPIADLFKLSHDFPSSQKAMGESAQPARGFTPLADSHTQAMAGKVQNSWAPGANYAPLIDDGLKPASGVRSVVDLPVPIRRERIIKDLADALGTTIYEGRVKGKNRLGFFRPGVEEVRTKRANDLEVTAHELAHLLDARVSSISNAWRSDSALREQLKSVSYDQKSVSEGFAEAVRLYLTTPETLAAKAPKAYAWLDEFANSHEYGPALKKTQSSMTSWFEQDALNRARSKIGDAGKFGNSPLMQYMGDW